MFYSDIQMVLTALFFWWLVLLLFQRLANRYPERNTWKKDILTSFYQSVLILILLPVLKFILNQFGY
ncbi:MULTISPECIES: hypothetical protein [Bacillus]|uniref:Uncharacterized protein n=1 Tax=Bacillus infantis TaxID=324767 RepID=A0A5D4RB36_9BACI|nr:MULTISPECIES: hypothetical protein [Bacillus]PLR71126.1 hypothetical protein CYJ37_20315 [Bacillus sp. UMB0728]TYS48615.1 hypothetical protein FZD51_10885 [Bacillus infantis]